jgi:hypothetical protein
LQNASPNTDISLGGVEVTPEVVLPDHAIGVQHRHCGQRTHPHIHPDDWHSGSERRFGNLLLQENPEPEGSILPAESDLLGFESVGQGGIKSLGTAVLGDRNSYTAFPTKVDSEDAGSLGGGHDSAGAGDVEPCGNRVACFGRLSVLPHLGNNITSHLRGQSEFPKGVIGDLVEREPRTRVLLMENAEGGVRSTKGSVEYGIEFMGFGLPEGKAIQPESFMQNGHQQKGHGTDEYKGVGAPPPFKNGGLRAEGIL